MNIVIYARFSSHAQNEQSIEGQLKTCYEYSERNGYKVIGEYIDRAISGTVAENRPEFMRMITDSAKRQFQAVLVYQLDRFARNRYDSATFKAKLKKNNVKVLSARENISDDASGILMESVLEGMAEYYSAELAQKVTRGLKINAEKCLSNGGGRFLGYNVDKDRRFVINDEEAVIVRQIFDQYIAGKTMAEIINYLNDSGVKTSRGNIYNKNSIRRILLNKRYCGVYIYDDVEVPDGMPRIIDDETFEQAQIILEKNKKAPARSKAIDEHYLLSTKIFCAFCGAALNGDSGHSKTGAIHQYYKCASIRKKEKCEKSTVRKAYIEDFVINETLKILTPERIDEISKAIEERCEKERNTAALKRLNKLIRENEKATANLVKSLEAGRVVDVIYNQIEKRQYEKADLEAQLAREKIQMPILKYEQMKFFFEKFTKGKLTDITFRQMLVDVLIARIELSNDQVTIYYNANDTQRQRPIPELKSSDMGRLVTRTGLEPDYPTYKPLQIGSFQNVDSAV